MMELVAFVQRLLINLQLDDIILYITDDTGQIVASTDPCVLDRQESACLLSETVAVSPRVNWQITAVSDDDRHASAVRNVKAALETAVYCLHLPKPSTRGREELIVEELLGNGGDNQQRETVLAGIFKKAGFDASQKRAVIVAELEEKTNRYFNINLDLGYDETIENARSGIVQAIRQSRYLNKQDIVAFYGYSTVVIVKAFMDISNQSKYYTALDQISNSLLAELDSNKIFSLKLAYGNVCGSLTEVKQSYQEAQLLIRLGSQFLGRNGLYRVEEMLLERVVYGLPPTLIEKRIKPLAELLKQGSSESSFELARIMETYINEGFNITETAAKLFLHRNTVSGKVDKYRSITKLDPANQYHDAVLTKFLVTYLRLRLAGIK